MGSSTSRRPPKRRNKVRRLPRIAGHIDPSEFGTQQSTFLVEGRIAAIGRLARGAKRAGPEQWRFLGRLFVGMFGAFTVLCLAIWLAARYL